jgi:HK97 family phage portal protein
VAGIVRRALKQLFRVKEQPQFPEKDRLFFLSPHLLLAQGGLTEPYREHVWVYACINAIAQNISGISLLFFTGNRQDKKGVENHPLIRVFDSPNPMMGGGQLIEAAFVFLGIYGEAFYLLDREQQNQVPREIWSFPPTRFREVLDRNTGLVSGWIYQRGATQVPLEPYEVIFFRYFNPYHDLRGLSPLAAAQAGVNQDYWASRYNQAFFQNSAIPLGVLEVPGNLDDDEFQRIKAQWSDRHQGVNKAHSIAILEGGATYKQIGLSQKDMDFLAQRKWNREEIMAVFKVPKGELGIYEDINYATARVQDKVFWQKTLLPKMSNFEATLWTQLFSKIEGGRIWAEFDYSGIDAIQEDFKEKVETGQKLWQMGWPINQINERLDLGMEAVPWGDTWFAPFNLTPVGQADIPPEKSIPYPLPSNRAGAAGPILPPTAPVQLVQGFDGEVYWQTYLGLHTPLEKKFEGKIRRFFFGQRKRQLRRLEERLGRGLIRELAVESLLLDPEVENGLLKKLVWPLYLDIGAAAGQALLAELGADPELFTLVDSPAMAALENKLIKVVGINDTVREQLRDTLIEGLGKMETTAELMDRVRKVYNFAQSRALTIARTETGQAAGAARDAAMGQMQVVKHRWVTAGDEHVRQSHQMLSGQVVERGQAFPNGCRFPCDPGGPAVEIINCRCVAAPVV